MKSLKTTARLTGLGYLIIFISGFFANFYTLESIIVDGSAQLTAENITTQFSQFKLGIAAFSLMVLVDIILAFPLYQLLKSENEKLATTSSILRLINGAIFALAMFSLFEIMDISNNPSIAVEAHIMQLLNQFNMVWNIGLLFFGAHLLLLGLLIFRSVSFPQIIGVLIQIAGVAYIADSGAQLFLTNYQDYQDVLEMVVISGGVLGEFSLTLFLLIKGVRSRKLSVPQFAI